MGNFRSRNTHQQTSQVRTVAAATTIIWRLWIMFVSFAALSLLRIGALGRLGVETRNAEPIRLQSQAHSLNSIRPWYFGSLPQPTTTLRSLSFTNRCPARPRSAVFRHDSAGLLLKS